MIRMPDGRKSDLDNRKSVKLHSSPRSYFPYLTQPLAGYYCVPLNQYSMHQFFFQFAALLHLISFHYLNENRTNITMCREVKGRIPRIDDTIMMKINSSGFEIWVEVRELENNTIMIILQPQDEPVRTEAGVYIGSKFSKHLFHKWFNCMRKIRRVNERTTTTW